MYGCIPVKYCNLCILLKESMYYYCCICILIVVYVFLLLSICGYFCLCVLIVVYVFLLLSMCSYCSSMYSYICICILTVVYVFLDAATLTEVFPCFFLGCKANARVKLTKTGHGPHSPIVVLFYVYRSMYCLCVNVYCTTATG
jgi:hypothetical protein